jgi:BirA family biotin operon repressor/biotin-[acetyl-CoA-carboxylase] ligase
VKAGPARVLDALRRAGGRSLSGETLSDELGVSRAQVWKHVQTLRARGYTIAAEPGDGYRLVAVPDRLYPEELRRGLRTHWLAHEILYYDEVDSTNRIALEVAQAGAAHGTTVVAEGQTAGRGRLGRSFFSPPHANLYTSVVLRPDAATDTAPAWILASAVAVADAIAETVGDDSAVEIKWPNDVLLGGLKTSGILMELGAEATRVAYLVLGIGVNLNVDRARFPGEFRHLATSLASHTGRAVDRIAFTQLLFEHLERDLDACAARGLAGVLPRFESRFRMPGRRAAVRALDGTESQGLVRGIANDGALLLVDEDGVEHRVVAGDVTVCKECA